MNGSCAVGACRGEEGFKTDNAPQIKENSEQMHVFFLCLKTSRRHADLVFFHTRPTTRIAHTDGLKQKPMRTEHTHARPQTNGWYAEGVVSDTRGGRKKKSNQKKVQCDFQWGEGGKRPVQFGSLSGSVRAESLVSRRCYRLPHVSAGGNCSRVPLSLCSCSPSVNVNL